MRLKKCVLSFLRKLLRDEISLMLDGNAFQARGPAVEKVSSLCLGINTDLSLLLSLIHLSRLWSCIVISYLEAKEVVS